MANGWQTDEYGNQVWMPINPGADPGTAWSATELGKVESTFFSGTGVDDPQWEVYGGYFDQYGTGEFYEKEKMQRVGAGIDIGQLGKAWDLKSGQLGDVWGTETTGTLGELFRQREGAGTTWRLQEEDILRKELEASGLWGMQKSGLEEGWKYKKGALVKGARSGLSQAISAQETATGKVGFARGGTREFQRIQREIREGYTEEATEGQRVLAQNLGIGEEKLSQTLGAYASQRDIGEETLRLERDRIGYLISSGQMTYDQAIESGQFQVGAGMTDIGQTLQENVWQTRQDWREQQRSTLHMLLGMDIWGEDGPPPPPPPPGDNVVVTDPNLDEEGGGGGYEYDEDYDFDWYGDYDYEGFGEDYGYEDYWEHEGEFS